MLAENKLAANTQRRESWQGETGSTFPALSLAQTQVTLQENK